ncbi:MAG TPA: hypothetical protein VI260_09995 [Blastocatellia bacterium]|jgi:hypothetical protein
MTNANLNNVTPIADKQTAPACRFTIQATLKGFPITIEGEGRAADLTLIVERLLAAGAEPPTSQAAQAEMKPVKQLPLCPAHGTPMKPSRRPGSYFCPRRDDKGEYCPHKA